ncbi:MAG: ATPase [Chlorobi bacterium]|nr:ATPase [Chlorobiota bacterium]
MAEDKTLGKHRKIAIPAEGNVLSMHFGKAGVFYIYETENNQVISVHQHQAPEHYDGVYPLWLKQKEVTDVISEGIGQKAIDSLLKAGINVFDGAPVKSPDELIADLLSGCLQSIGNFCDH